MKKSLVLALVAVLVLSFASMAFAFTDADNSWAKTEIAKLVDLKVVNGMTATTFVPEGKVTRAEFAKMIVNAKGLALENPAKATFSDVATTAWEFPYVEAAAKAGYIAGTGNGKFEPKANITREQVAKMIVLAAGKTADATKALNFDDKAQIADWAKGYVAVAADLKLVQGYNNKFNPTANATRAEAAKLTYSELVFEGKIVPVVTVAADVVTDLKLDNTQVQYPLLAITIGGKRYEVDPKVDVTLNAKEVNGYAVRKNTHVKFTLDKDDIVTKLELATVDYATKDAKVEAKGTNFAIVAGTKVAFDTTASNYVSVDSDAKKITKVEPSVGTKYYVILDETGKGYYWANDNASTVKGIVEYVGKDTKVYLYVSGKKYLVDATDLTAVAVTGYSWAQLAGQYVEFDMDSNDYVTSLQASTVKSGFVAGKPVLVGSASVGWDVYVKVAQEPSNNKYDTTTSATYFWVHYDASGLDYINDTDVPDHAVKQASSPAAAGDKVITLEKYASIYVDGASKNLTNVSNRGYVVFKYKETGKINQADFYAASAKGRVEKITKDSSDNVIALTIAGKEYKYVGVTSPHSTTDEGNVWVAATNTPEVLATDELVTAALNTDGNIVTIIKHYVTNLENEATVTAVGGGKSIMSNGTASSALYVPANTIEVKYKEGGLYKIAWLTYAWKDNDGTANRSYGAKEEGISLVTKANASVAFSSIAVGNVIDFTTKAAITVVGKEGYLLSHLYNTTGTVLTDGDYGYDTNSQADGSRIFTVSGAQTASDTITTIAAGASPFSFTSYEADFISVR